MPFLGPLRFERVGRRDALLLEPLVYVDKRGWTWTVPAGFRTDFDSRPSWLPLLFNVLIGTQLEISEESVLHDWGYRTDPGGRGKSFWDRLFYEALESGDADDWNVGAWTAWAGVYFGGWWAWRGNRKRERGNVVEGEGA